MRRSHANRILFASAVLAILLAVAYTWWWLAFAYGARGGVERWAERQRARGWQVSYSDITLRGYPFVLTMRLRNPHVAEPGRFDWQGPDLIANISPLSPTTIHLRAPGKHQLDLTGVDSFELDVGAAQATLTTTALGRLTSGSAMLQNVAVTSPAGESSLDSLQIQIEEMTSLASRTVEAVPSNLSFGLALTNLSLPSRIKMPFGRRIDAATLRGRLRGQWEPIAFNEALANWRDGGGVIEMDQVMLTWEPLSLSANGTVALDQRLQPLVAMTARMTGFFETVDALTAANLVRSRDASMAKMVLGLLSKRPANGGPAVLELPLTVQDGVFYAGPAALGKVPELPWEAPPPVPIPNTYPLPKREDPKATRQK